MCTAIRIKDNIYTDFPSEKIRPCFRRLNGTHEVGCTTGHSGNVGVVQVIEVASDVDLVRDDTFAPYMVVVNPTIFGGDLLSSLKDTGNVNGAVLPGIKSGRWKNKVPSQGSEDMKCPNLGSSLYQKGNPDQCGTSDVWNPAGQNLLFQDWGFPIFLVEDSQTTDFLIEDCFEKHNKITENRTKLDWPLCSVELKSNMYAARDSETCVRRSNLQNNITPVKVCDQLSDYNVYYFLEPRNGTKGTEKVVQKDNSVIVVTARLDALSLFDQTEVGFDSPTTGIVALMSAARLLKQAYKIGKQGGNQLKEGVENVMFLLLHGESFDYIGSSRLVYDMINDAFPYNLTESAKSKRFYDNGTQNLLNISHIRSILELGQMSNVNSDNDVFLHLDRATASLPETEKIISEIKNSAGSSTTVRRSSKTSLPPASAQTFLKARPTIPTVMLTNFDRSYANNLYHSIYDDAERNNYNYTDGPEQAVVRHVAEVARIVAETVYTLATGSRRNMEADPELVNELLNCYTQDANCSLSYIAGDPESYPWTTAAAKRKTTPWPQYVGVRSSTLTAITKQFFQYMTGDDVEVPQEEEDMMAEDDSLPDLAAKRQKCLDMGKKQHVFTYVFLVNDTHFNKSDTISKPSDGVCFKTTVFMSPASSPAFLDNIVDSYDWSSGLYPTWTESIWKVISGRIFLRASPSQDYWTLATGLVVLVVSFVVVYWTEKNAHLIFNCQPECRLGDNGPVSM